jgi:predicted alpha/beta superfamily hydrolase
MARSGLGDFLSLLTLVILGTGCSSAPTAAPAPAPPPAATHQAAATPEPVLPHQTFTLDSKVLGETRRINVYTPPGLDAAQLAPLPVVYMPDGGVKEDFPHVTSSINTAIRAGEMRPVVVVGIENTERRRDMTGPTQVEADRKIAKRVGGSASFRAFIRDELMPVIKERLRSSGPTAIIGESLAGLFVVETFFLEPGLFNIYIAISPSLYWNNKTLARAARERLSAMQGLNVTFYLAGAGDDDIGDAVKGLSETLRDHAPSGLKWHFEPRPDLQHSTIYRAIAPGVFRKLFPTATPMEPPAGPT